MLRGPTLAALIVCALVVPLAAAPRFQDAPAKPPAAPVAQSEFDKEFQRGYTALTTGKLEEGIAIFVALAAQQPANPGVPYNVACGYALKGDPAKAMEWLAKSVELGFGNTPFNTDQLETNDTDLKSLRTQAGWPKLVERMHALRREFDDYVATAAVYVPPQLAGAAELPLLVVLHAQDGNKDTVIRGPWKAVADACGVALVAPSGRVPIGLPANGVSWFDTLDNYAKAHYTYEKPVDAALIAFQNLHAVDKSRVFIAGEGAGGVVATTLALWYPSVYRGAISCDGLILEPLVGSRAKAAAKAGLTLDVLISEPPGPPDAALHAQLVAAVDAVASKLKAWGLAGSATLIPAGADARQAAFTKSLAAMLAACPPVEKR